jgi:hypothetical protein
MLAYLIDSVGHRPALIRREYYRLAFHNPLIVSAAMVTLRDSLIRICS